MMQEKMKLSINNKGNMALYFLEESCLSDESLITMNVIESINLLTTRPLLRKEFNTELSPDDFKVVANLGDLKIPEVGHIKWVIKDTNN